MFVKACAAQSAKEKEVVDESGYRPPMGDLGNSERERGERDRVKRAEESL